MSEQENIQAFVCDSIGVTTGEVTVKEVHNGMGQHYFIASAPIGSLFGMEVEGECKGIGRTKEQALQRLAEDRKQLAESLWY